MLKELDFTKHNLSDFRFGLNQIFADDLVDASRRKMKELMETTLTREFDDYIELKWYQHSDRRKDYRNGFRNRDLMTTLGLIKEIRVPRSRKRGFEPRVFDRYKRAQHVVDAGILKMYLMGVSTRKVGDILEALFSYTVSATYVSKVSKRLDGNVNTFHNRLLKDDFLYLFLDGIHVKIRHVSKSVKRVILTAYGVRADGSRELIDFRVAKSEGKGAWTSFLENLKLRGLRGSKLALVISDGCPGLWAAAEEIYPFVEHQLCWVHKLRNVSNYCPARHREQCIAQARQIYLSPTVKIGMRKFREWEKAWRELVPKAAACLGRDIDKLLVFLNCPRQHHKKIRTTNVIERQFREIRRRLRVMGTFPDADSAERMIFSLFVYHNTRWERPNTRIKEIAATHKNKAA